MDKHFYIGFVELWRSISSESCKLRSKFRYWNGSWKTEKSKQRTFICEWSTTPVTTELQLKISLSQLIQPNRVKPECGCQVSMTFPPKCSHTDTRWVWHCSNEANVPNKVEWERKQGSMSNLVTFCDDWDFKSHRLIFLRYYAQVLLLFTLLILLL